MIRCSYPALRIEFSTLTPRCPLSDDMTRSFRHRSYRCFAVLPTKSHLFWEARVGRAMAKRTLDAFLVPSPGKRESPRLARKVPRLSDENNYPAANGTPKRKALSSPHSRKSSCSPPSPVPPRPATTKEDAIIIDSDDDDVKDLHPLNEVVNLEVPFLILPCKIFLTSTTLQDMAPSKKLCIVCSKHEILASLDLCAVCMSAFEEVDNDPFRYFIPAHS